MECAEQMHLSQDAKRDLREQIGSVSFNDAVRTQAAATMARSGLKLSELSPDPQLNLLSGVGDSRAPIDLPVR